MQYDCLYKMDFYPLGPHTPGPAPRGHIKIPNVFLQSSSIGLIHRAITCDSFKVLAKKAQEEFGDNQKKKDLKAYFLTSSDPQICPCGKIFAPLYSTLHNLRFDMQHGYVCIKRILDLQGHTPLALPQGVISKFQMCSSSPHP